MEKYIILILIIIFFGTFGGVVRYLNTYDTAEPTNGKIVLKYILTGIGSATLIPLFLNMLSSDLLSGDEISMLNYFIFAGFCFIGAFLSEKFISSIGERILNEVKQVKKDQEIDKKNIDALIENESEPEEGTEEKSEKLEEVITSIKSKSDNPNKLPAIEVLKVFKEGSYRFRSLKGISKELGYPEDTAMAIIKTFEDNGLLRTVRRTKDNKTLWGITSRGKFMVTNNDKG